MMAEAGDPPQYSQNVLPFPGAISQAPPSGKGPLNPTGGGGTFDGMEARVAKLEAAADYIQRDVGEIKIELRTLCDNARTDFRLLFGAIITTTLGLAALMAKGFHW